MTQQPLFEDQPVEPDRVKARPDHSPLAYLTGRQQLWGRRRGVRLQGSAVERGEPLYCPSLAENLFLGGLTPGARREYEAADGHELGSKMRALHSSSAAVDYWRSVGDFDPALRALKLPTGSSSVTFEARLPISSRFATAPNVDLLVTYPSAPAVVLESKFGEPFGREHGGFSAKYLGVPSVWSDLPNLRKLAEQITGGVDPSYAYVHAGQLIKHTLGATAAFGRGRGRFVLVYFYHAVRGEAGAEHEREVRDFAAYHGSDGVPFKAVSHQSYVLRLGEAERDRHPAFVDWIAERYL